MRVMNTRVIARSGVCVSELTLGMWGLTTGAYGETPVQHPRACVEAALECGYRSFDCAPFWAEGESERVVGEVTASRRDEVSYITRVSGAEHDAGLSAFHQACRDQLEGSLGRLKTERVDVLLLNHPPSSLLDERGWDDVFRELQSEGKIRSWGVSTSRPSTARLALRANPDTLCIPYSLLSSGMLDEISGELTEANCSVLARSPLAYGMLGNGWGKFHCFAEGDHRRERWNRRAFEKRIQQLYALRFLVRDEVPSMLSAALRYALAHPSVVTLLHGARTPDQIASAADVIGEPPYLSEDDLVQVQEILTAAQGLAR